MDNAYTKEEFDAAVDDVVAKYRAALEKETESLRNHYAQQVENAVVLINPGKDDVIVLTYPAPITNKLADHMQEVTGRLFPDNRVVILEGGWEIRIAANVRLLGLAAAKKHCDSLE